MYCPTKASSLVEFMKSVFTLRQDSKKLGKLLGKWKRETETECSTRWPSNLQPGADGPVIDQSVDTMSPKRAHLENGWIVYWNLPTCKKEKFLKTKDLRYMLSLWGAACTISFLFFLPATFLHRHHVLNSKAMGSWQLIPGWSPELLSPKPPFSDFPVS